MASEGLGPFKVSLLSDSKADMVKSGCHFLLPIEFNVHGAGRMAKLNRGENS